MRTSIWFSFAIATWFLQSSVSLKLKIMDWAKHPNHSDAKNPSRELSDDNVNIRCGTPSPSKDEQADFAKVVEQWTNANFNIPRSDIIVTTHFHIITNLAGTFGFVSQQAIDDILENLNDAFRPYNFQFVHGFNSPAYVASDRWFEGDEIVTESEYKTALRRGGADVLNIYSKHLPGFWGYATFPQTYCRSGTAYDGVVVDWTIFPEGSISRQSTLVHEVGHWLNLYHTFQNGCLPPGDGIDDTPAHVVGFARDCPLDRDTCPLEPGNDPVNNYMNYAEDACRIEFTDDQALAMHAAWDTYRADSKCDNILDSALPGFCFSPEATISVKNKGQVSMKDIVAGDQVLTASGDYQTVFMIDHYHKSQPTHYLQIYTKLVEQGIYSDSKPLELTWNHMIFVPDKSYPILASDLSVGDFVETIQGPQEVIEIKSIIRNGLYNPMTVDGTIVVDGIVASTYSSFIQKSHQYHIEVSGFKLFSLQFLLDLTLAPYRTICMTVSLDICNWHEEGDLPSVYCLALGFYDIWRQQNDFFQLLLLLGYISALSVASCMVDPLFVFVVLGLLIVWTLFPITQRPYDNKTATQSLHNTNNSKVC